MDQGSNYNPYQAPASDGGEGKSDQLSGEEPRLASRSSRLGAVLLDGLLQGLVIFPLQYAFGVYDNFPRPVPSATTLTSVTKAVVWLVVSLVVFVAFHGYLLAKNGQTIGKRWLGIKIVSFADGSVPPLTRIVLLRYLPMQALILIPFVGGVVVFVGDLMIFRRDHRCLHDHIAGTLVIKA